MLVPVYHQRVVLPGLPGNDFQIQQGIGYIMKTNGTGAWPASFNPG